MEDMCGNLINLINDKKELIFLLLLNQTNKKLEWDNK